MTLADTTEFDAFGPWIDQVATESAIPRLFRAHRFDLGAAIVVLKVPRNIARRDANPAMDLYDLLLIVEPHAFTVLRREDASFTTRVIRYADIAAFEDSVELLDGLFIVHTMDGDSVRVPYNGSSRATIASLTDELRRLVAPTLVPHPEIASRPPLERGELGRDGNGLVAAYREIAAKEPWLRLVAAHANRRLTTSGGVVDQLALWVRRATLQGAIVSISDTELSIVSRRDWVVPGKRPALSESRRIVPLDRLAAVSVAPHPRFVGVSAVTLAVGQASIVCVVPTGSPAEAALAALAPRR